MTIGVAYVLITPKAITSTVAGIHQRRPNRRMPKTSSAPPIPTITAWIAVPLTSRRHSRPSPV